MEQHAAQDPAAVGLAVEIEQVVGAGGWDQPPTLWSIDGGRRFQLDRTLDGHPVDALIGVRLTSDGCALATEGWTYSDDKFSLLAEGLRLEQPSTYADSIEVRVVHVVLANGSEAVVQRHRDGDVTLFHPSVGDGLTGTVVESTRRVMGLPSGASPSAVAEIRERIMLEGICRLLGALIDRGMTPAQALDHSDRTASVVQEVVAALGLNATDWETARAHALAHPGSDIFETEFAAWADGPLWGQRLGDGFETSDELRRRLAMLCAGVPGEPQRLLKLLGVRT